MAEKRTATPGPSTTLQRGKACLRCRKRKMKCDGAKPACQQCVRAKKSEACEYDDGKGKTRTQLMREHIQQLELRIKELESTDYRHSPSVTLFDPHAPSPYLSESSSSSSHDSPGGFSLSTSASPVPFSLDPEHPSWEGQWNSMGDFATTDVLESFAPEEPPFELAQMLLNHFLAHRHQCGFELHAGRLRESLHLPLTERRHPVLMNAIFLWACYLSRPNPLSQHEDLYLTRALASISDAAKHSSKVIDLIQASCLLSLYFLSNACLPEGSYHAGAAASLALQWGLHQIGSPEVTPPSAMMSDWDRPFTLDPPKDSIEQGERILTFWQVYDLDRCWSVALQRPAMLPDSKHPKTTITTPWPQRMEEYEAGEVDWGRSGQPTISAFFMHQAQATTLVGGFSTAALRVKASSLLEGANKLSSSWNPRLSPTNNFMDNFRAFEATIARFTTTLLPLHQLAATMPDDKYTLYMIHSLSQTAVIRLHHPFIADNQMSREKSLLAARAVTLVTKHITEPDFEYLDPLLGHCWVSAARVFVFELVQRQSAWPPVDVADIRGELSTLLFALVKLGTRYPLLGFEAAKMQKILDGLVPS